METHGVSLHKTDWDVKVKKVFLLRYLHRKVLVTSKNLTPLSGVLLNFSFLIAQISCAIWKASMKREKRFRIIMKVFK